MSITQRRAVHPAIEADLERLVGPGYGAKLDFEALESRSCADASWSGPRKLSPDAITTTDRTMPVRA